MSSVSQPGGVAQSDPQPANPRFVIPAPLRLAFRTLSTVAPSPTARLAWHIFAKPSRTPRADRYGVWQDAEAFTLRAGPHQLPAWAWGDGPTALLLHGWGSSAVSMGAFVRPLVEAGFRVVTYDAFAHGTSPGVTTSGPEMARHLNDIATHLDARHIVAHSMGTVVVGFALQGGLSLERTVLLNAPADMPHFLSLFTRGLGFSEGVERRMIRRFEEEHDVRWADCVVEWVAAGQTHPTLLVHDEGDIDIPWSHAQRVRSAWKNHHAITTRGLGHRGGLHVPEIASATVAFLRGEDQALPSEVVATDQATPTDPETLPQPRSRVGPTS